MSESGKLNFFLKQKKNQMLKTVFTVYDLEGLKQ